MCALAQNRPPQLVDTLVTNSEFQEIRVRVNNAITKVLTGKFLKPKFTTLSPKKSSVKREEIIRTCEGWLEFSKPYWKMKFVPVKFDGEGVAKLKNASSKKSLIRLVQAGFVSSTSPLVTRTSGLQVREMGELIGGIITRIADLTHKPVKGDEPWFLPDAKPKPAGKDKSSSPAKSG